MKERLPAFHSFWSLPNSCRNHGEIRYADYELLTAILSALKWREYNGPVYMLTDTPGKQYFQKLGLLSLWDRVETTLDQVDSSINPFLFWAGGKLYALKSMKVPCVMLDTDLIVWKDVRDRLTTDIVAAHFEGLNPETYPDKDTFHLKGGYSFPAEWDFGLCAANTAFLYMKDGAFRDEYVEQAIRFFTHVDLEGLNPVTAMCFAEQRILPMCAKAGNRSMSYLLDLRCPERDGLATHTWGFKYILENQPQAREEYCMRLVKRIMKDFPEREALLEGREDLKNYLLRYREAGKE